MTKTPSPCISVCKFKREGHCIGCSMTKDQKSLYKKIKKKAHKEGFIALLMAQQKVMGRYDGWRIAYEKKCKKKGAKAPFPVSSEASN